MDILTLLWWIFILNAFSLLVLTFILLIVAFAYKRLISYEYITKIQNSIDD